MGLFTKFKSKRTENALGNLSVDELQAALRERQLSVEELVRYYLSRIERYGGKKHLNAVSQVNEAAIERAKLLDASDAYRDTPLFGMPILVKDNIDVAGLFTTAGSFTLRDNLAQRNAPIIDNIEKNGGIILGKTNMTEFANYTTQGMPGGFSSLGGQVKNAYCSRADASGSSTGSAVAMSADLCAMAVGTDTSFSVVACATLHGVVGMKPPVGALSSEGIVPISKTMDSAGMLTRRVKDALLLYQGMSGDAIVGQRLSRIKKKPANELRLAINVFHQEMVSKEQQSYYDELCGRLSEAGTEFTEVNEPYSEHLGQILISEYREDLEEYLSHSNARLKTMQEIVTEYQNASKKMRRYGITKLEESLRCGRSTEQYKEAMRVRERTKQQIFEELADFDACIMTGPTSVMHFVGIPSVSVPICMGMPKMPMKRGMPMKKGMNKMPMGMPKMPMKRGMPMKKGMNKMPRSIILYGTDEERLFSAALTVEAFAREITKPKL